MGGLRSVMPPRECFIGIDLGTTAVKVGAFDLQGNAVAFKRSGFELHRPHPGHVEFDALAWYDSMAGALAEVAARARAAGSTVAGIGLSSQAQTFVLLDENRQPVRPTVSWLDTRAQAEAAEFSDKSLHCTGRPADAIASAPKILWLARHEPETFARCKYVALLPDYVTWRLTGKQVTSLRSAESTGLYDLERGDWIEPLLAHCGLSRAMLPDVASPCELAGQVTEAAAAAAGILAGIPVACGAMDHLAGAIGTGNAAPGIASAALGTALAVIASTRENPSSVPGVAQRPHPVPELRALLSYSKTAGVVLDWCRNMLAPHASYDDLLAEAARAPRGSDGVMCFPHFAGMASPTFDPEARGAFVGLALHHTRAHLIRAVIEALCYLMRENLERLANSGASAQVLRVTGGGAQSDFWLQMIADVCAVPVERPCISEAPCFGAAQFAMVAKGRFTSVAESSTKLYRAAEVFQPRQAESEVYGVLYRNFCRVQAQVYPT